MSNSSNKAFPWIDYVLEICTGITHFVVDGVKVFIACNDMEYPADSHAHNDIEFMCVKRQQLDDILCDDKVLSLPCNHIMPFMPMQRHGCNKAVVIKQYIGIAYPPEYYNKFIGQINNFNFNFQNIPFPASSRFDYLVGYLFESYAKNSGEATLKCILELIFLELCRDYLDYIEPTKQPQSELNRAKCYLDNHINLPFNLDETARVANLSKYYFCKQFKENFKVTPSEYLMNKKIERSKNLMMTSDMSVTEIALSLGFNSLSHFSRHFKQLTGLSPSEFNKKIVK